jgi:hypothetical protein
MTYRNKIDGSTNVVLQKGQGRPRRTDAGPDARHFDF